MRSPRSTLNRSIRSQKRSLRRKVGVATAVIALCAVNVFLAAIFLDSRGPAESSLEKVALRGLLASDEKLSHVVPFPVAGSPAIEGKDPDSAEVNSETENTLVLARRQLEETGKPTSGAGAVTERKREDEALPLPQSSDASALFIKRGDKYFVTSRQEMDLQSRLPVGNYVIGINPMSGEYYLKLIESFEIQGKIYGDTQKQAKRILDTFMDRQKGKSTGVLLTGEQGSGKTFLAKYISIQAALLYNIPTVVVNQPLAGEKFNTFIQSIHQPVVFLFDEFEKIYSDRDPNARAMRAQMEMYDSDGRRPHPEMTSANQDSMLTLLDGTYPSQMLFLLTTNDKFRINKHMKNRPGRIYYVLDFKGLPPKFIEDYCQDRLNAKELIPQVVAVASLFEGFSFDMLQAVVEEMNRYGETPDQVLEMLNVRPEFSSGTQYSMKLIVNGKEISRNNIYSGRGWWGNPLVNVIKVEYQKPFSRPSRAHMIMEDADEEEISEVPSMETEGPPMEEEEMDRGPQQLEFTAEDIDEMDTEQGIFAFWDEKKRARLILTKQSFVTASTATLLENLRKAKAKKAASDVDVKPKKEEKSAGDAEKKAKAKEIVGKEAPKERDEDGN